MSGRFLAIAIGIGVGVILPFLTLVPGLRADDWLLHPLLSVPDEPGKLSWQAAVDDWGSPWLASDSWPYYRPISTLSYVFWLKLWGFHSNGVFLWGPMLWIVSIVLFASITRCFIDRIGPIIAGTVFFSLHPVAIEPCQWFSATPEVLQLCFSLGGILLWMRYREDRALWTAVCSSLLLFCSLLTRESGFVALPVAYMLGWAVNPQGPDRSQLSSCFKNPEGLGVANSRAGIIYAHALIPLIVPLVLYATMRVMVLGPDKALMIGSNPASSSLALSAIPERIVLMLDPLIISRSVLTVTFAVITLLVLGVALFRIAGTKQASILIIILFVQLAPGIAHPVGSDLGGSRVLLWAICGSGWIWAKSLDVAMRPRDRLKATLPLRVALVLGFLGAISGSVVAISDRASATREALAISKRIVKEADNRIVEMGGPLAILALPESWRGITLFLPRLSFPLMSSCSTGHRNPLIDLTCTYRSVADAAEVFGLGTPLRAAGEAGARFIIWNPSGAFDPAARLLEMRNFPVAKERREIELTSEGLGRYLFSEGPQATFNVEEFYIENVEGGVPTSLAMVFADGHVGPQILLDDNKKNVWVWIRSSSVLIEALARGGIAGVIATGGESDRGKVRLHAFSRVEKIPSPDLDEGKSYTVDDLYSRLTPPSVEHAAKVSCLLAGPAFVSVAKAGPGGKGFVWNPQVKDALDWCLKLEPRPTFVIWFEGEDSSGKAFRSDPRCVSVKR